MCAIHLLTNLSISKLRLQWWHKFVSITFFHGFYLRLWFRIIWNERWEVAVSKWEMYPQQSKRNWGNSSNICAKTWKINKSDIRRAPFHEWANIIKSILLNFLIFSAIWSLTDTLRTFPCEILNLLSTSLCFCFNLSFYVNSM